MTMKEQRMAELLAEAEVSVPYLDEKGKRDWAEHIYNDHPGYKFELTFLQEPKDPLETAKMRDDAVIPRVSKIEERIIALHNESIAAIAAAAKEAADAERDTALAVNQLAVQSTATTAACARAVDDLRESAHKDMLTSTQEITAAIKHEPREMKIWRWLIVALLLFLAAQSLRAQQSNDLILRWKENGTTLVTRSAGLLNIDCTTNTVCTWTAATNTIAITASGGSGGCATSGSAGQILVDDGAGGCTSTTPTISGSTITASLSGNASTATALAANPTDCSANQFANAIAASGNLTCAQVAFSDLSGTATDAQIPNLNTLSTGLTNSRCVETDGSGLLVSAAAACGTGGGGITIGTTTITSGNDTRVLYNNAGVVGQYVISGSGNVCMTTSCVMVTPTLGVATATSVNGLTITSSTGTLTITNAKTLAVSNTLTFTGTDLSSVAFGAGGTVVYTARTINTTSPLGGGGDLSADRTITCTTCEVSRTKRIDIMWGSGVTPDATGNFFFEPYTIKATNDFWGHQIGVFNDSASTACWYGIFTVPGDYNSSGTTKFIGVTSSTATTNNYVLTLDYRDVTGDDTTSLDQATAQESLTVTDAAPTAANRRLLPSMTATASNMAAGDTVEIKTCRTSGAAGDTMAAALQMHEMYFEYTSQ